MSDRQQRKERYYAVLRTIAGNTTEKQPPGIRPIQLATHLCGPYNRYDREELDKTLTAAKQNGDIVRWTDAEGQLRVTLTNQPDLERLVSHVAEELKEPKQLGRINTRLQEVRENGE